MEDLTGERTSTRDYLRIIFKRKGIIIPFFLGVVLVVAIGSFVQEPIYRAGTTVLIEYTEEEPVLGIRTRSADNDSVIQTQTEMIKSRTIAERVVRTLNLDKKDGEKKQGLDSFQNAALTLQKNIKVTPIRKTDLIEVSLEGKDPQKITETTNVLAQTYIKYHFETKGTQRHTTFDFINEQLKIARQNLNESDEKLKQFKEKENIAILKEETTEDLRKLSQLETLLTTELAGFTNKHPQVAKSKKEVQRLTDKLKKLPEKDLELARLIRAVANAEEIYLMLQKRLEETRISAAMDVEKIASIRNIRIVDPAVVPLHPFKPKKLLNVMLGCIVGMVGLLGLAFFSEYYDHTLDSPEDIKKYLNIPVLGVIPLLVEEKNKNV